MDFYAAGGTLVLASEGGEVQGWDLSKGKSMFNTVIKSGELVRLRFSETGKDLILASSKGQIQIWSR
jgi:WD40 repeat protein